MAQVEDEYGTNWLVKAGDPANSYINTLKAKGFELIILPRRTLATGELTLTEWLPGDIMKEARLADSLGVLSE